MLDNLNSFAPFKRNYKLKEVFFKMTIYLPLVLTAPSTWEQNIMPKNVFF